MRKSLSLAAIAMLSLVAMSTPATAATKDFSDQLDSIKDEQLRRTLSNSIAIGLISTDEELQAAISQAIDSEEEDNMISCEVSRKKPKNNHNKPNNHNNNNNNHSNNGNGGSSANNSALSQKITELSKNLYTLDQKANVKVQKNEGRKGATMLFKDITTPIPAAYDKCLKLCNLFDPHTNTPEMGTHKKAISEFFHSIENDPCVQEALKITHTSIDDMMNNWFGSGAGFEHVIAGEIKGTKVSGYHWWYRYYTDERNGHVEYINSMEAIGNPRMYTGSYTWDPDGNGPLPTCKKPKGGFTLQHSPMALLALGHIAIETCRASGSIPGSLTFKADVNGESFTWQLYTMNGTIRSLYPMANR